MKVVRQTSSVKIVIRAAHNTQIEDRRAEGQNALVIGMNSTMRNAESVMHSLIPMIHH